MSTRSVFTFKSTGDVCHVYQHHDGYPSGAHDSIAETLTSGKAWPLPRFEACEFAAAFIAANKECGGGFCITKGPKSHGDLAYRYEVSCKAGTLRIRAFEVRDVGEETVIFDGPWDKFRAFAFAKQPS